MKKILFATLFILVTCSLTFSQNKLPELEQIKKIKIFESTQKDVKKILAKYVDEDYDDDDFEQLFYIQNSEIKVTFSSGDCGDESEYWNVSKWLVTSIVININESLKSKDAGFDFSKFKKEVIDEEHPEDFDYHDESSGIFAKVDDGEVYKVVFYPPKSKEGFLCSNKNGLEIISGKKRFVDIISQVICVNRPPVFNDIILDKSEIINPCKGNDEKDKKCERNKQEISVRVVATDAEGDVLTYNYTVTGGQIVGKGSKVIWDLSNVSSGTYKITATVDDGCGVCVVPKTKTVVVKQ